MTYYLEVLSNVRKIEVIDAINQYTMESLSVDRYRTPLFTQYWLKTNNKDEVPYITSYIKAFAEFSLTLEKNIIHYKDEWIQNNVVKSKYYHLTLFDNTNCYHYTYFAEIKNIETFLNENKKVVILYSREITLLEYIHAYKLGISTYGKQ